MKTYFGGAEVPTYRELMHERGVLRMSMNWISHRRRAQDTTWSIDEHFPAGTEVFVDSGARTYNRPGVEVPLGEIEDLANDYYAFIEANLTRIDGYLEFDARQLKGHGEGSLESWRTKLDAEKGIVVWHAQDGVEELERLCAIYPRVAVSDKTVEDEELLPLYRRLARQTQLHLIGADRSLMVQHVAWYSCHFTSWISAQQRGETFVWAGHELRRYDAPQKAVARRRHRALFESLGLSADAIARDDPTENLKLALWSWQQHFASLERPIDHQVTVTPNPSTSESVDPTTDEVARTFPDWDHDVVTGRGSKPRQVRPIPGLETTSHTVYITDPADGARRPQTETRVATADPGVRVCDGCFLASKCPAYEPGSACAYSIPVRIATKEQRAALFDAIIEMQAQRVFFMRLAEEGDGGYSDKALSAEIDRLGRLLKVKDDMEAQGFTLTVKAQQRGEAQTGLLTRLFGREAEPLALPPNEGVSHAEAAMLGIIDAEIIDEKVTGTDECRHENTSSREVLRTASTKKDDQRKPSPPDE